MKQTILLFARAAELAGTTRLEITLPAHATIADLRKILLEQAPALQTFAGTLFIALNNKYADDTDVIPDKAEIACFPPVSGG